MQESALAACRDSGIATKAGKCDWRTRGLIRNSQLSATRNALWDSGFIF